MIFVDVCPPQIEIKRNKLLKEIQGHKDDIEHSLARIPEVDSVLQYQEQSHEWNFGEGGDGYVSIFWFFNGELR